MLTINASNGNEISRHLFGVAENSQNCYNGIKTTDNNYLMVGKDRMQMCAIKSDIEGNIIWYKTYGDSLHEYNAQSVQETCDSGLIVTGGVWSCHYDQFNQLNCDTVHFFLNKLDKFGNQQWEKIWGYTNDTWDFISSLKKYNNDNYIAVGKTNTDIYTLRIDSLANCPALTINKDDGDLTFNAVNIHPNPLFNNAFIEISEQCQNNDLKFVMYDIYGKEIKDMKLENKINKFERSNLPEGIYFYRILENGKIIQTGKLLLLGSK